MLDFFKKMLGLKDKPLPRKEKEMLKKPELHEAVMEKKEKQEPEVVEPVEAVMETQEEEKEIQEEEKETQEEEKETQEEEKETQEEEEAYVTNMPEHNFDDSKDFHGVIDDEEHEGDRELAALEQEEESD